MATQPADFPEADFFFFFFAAADFLRAVDFFLAAFFVAPASAAAAFFPAAFFPTAFFFPRPRAGAAANNSRHSSSVSEAGSLSFGTFAFLVLSVT